MIAPDIRVLVGEVGGEAARAAGGMLANLRAALVPAHWSPSPPAPAERRESSPTPITPATLPNPGPPATGLPHVAASFSAAKHLEGDLMTAAEPVRDLLPTDRLERFRPGGYHLDRRVLVPVCCGQVIVSAWTMGGTGLKEHGFRGRGWPRD